MLHSEWYPAPTLKPVPLKQADPEEADRFYSQKAKKRKEKGARKVSRHPSISLCRVLTSPVDLIFCCSFSCSRFVSTSIHARTLPVSSIHHELQLLGLSLHYDHPEYSTVLNHVVSAISLLLHNHHSVNLSGFDDNVDFQSQIHANGIIMMMILGASSRPLFAFNGAHRCTTKVKFIILSTALSYLKHNYYLVSTVGALLTSYRGICEHLASIH